MAYVAKPHKFNVDTYQGQYDYHTQYPDDWYYIHPTTKWQLEDYKALFQAKDGGTLVYDDDTEGWIINPHIKPEELFYIDEDTGDKHDIEVIHNTRDKAMGWVSGICSYGVFNIECIGRPHLLADFFEYDDAKKFYDEETK